MSPHVPASDKSLRCKLLVAVLAAAALWFYMFSPWTGSLTNFWLTMSLAAVILTTFSLLFTTDRKELLTVEKPLLQFIVGVVIAFALWGIFWIGDKLSSLVFDFARPEVDAVYSMKNGLPAWVIAILLLFVIGPAEELFWRGFVQRSFSKFINPGPAFILTTGIYALVHIWSFNFMLVMAALVAGSVWGFLYRVNPKLLPSLIVSHAFWDALVFVILPI